MTHVFLITTGPALHAITSNCALCKSSFIIPFYTRRILRCELSFSIRYTIYKLSSIFTLFFICFFGRGITFIYRKG